MAAQISPGKRLPTPGEQIQVLLISGLLLIIGLALIAYQGYLILTNEEVAEAIDPTYIGMGATIQKIEPMSPEDAEPKAILLLDDGLLADSGLASGDIVRRINGTSFDFEALNVQTEQRLLDNERNRLVERELSRNVALTLLTELQESLNNNELVAAADVSQLAQLVDGYPNSDRIISGLRDYTITDQELQQLIDFISAEVETEVVSVEDIAGDFVVTRDAFEQTRQTLLEENIVSLLATTGESVVLFEVERAGETLTVEVSVPSNGQPDADSLGLGLRVAYRPALVLQIDDDSLAEAAGLRNGDVVVSLNGTPYSATQLMAANGLSMIMTEQELGEELRPVLVELIQSAFAEADEAPVTFEVWRDGEVINRDFPQPDPETDEALGLRIFVAELPYFQILPRANGPADQDIDAGSALMQLDDTSIFPDMSEAVVQDLANDDDIPLADEDFRIGVAYKELNADGGFELTADMRRINKQVPPELFMAYLYNFGLFVPLVVVIFGLLISRTGIRLISYDIVAARWTGVILLWGLVGLIVIAIREFYVAGSGGSLGSVGDNPFEMNDAFAAIIPFIVLAIPVAFALRRLGHIIEHIFSGEESLTSRNTRFAWSLLIPTLAVLILVAARPLEQTFIASLTDDELATTTPARFVGFQNYQQLLSLNFDVVECKKPTPEQLQDEPITRANANQIRLLEAIRFDTSLLDPIRKDAIDRIDTLVVEPNSLEPDDCLTTGDGGTDWELSQDLLVKGYREATVISLPFSKQGLRILGKDEIFLKGIFNTMQFTIISVTLELILGMVIALVVNTKFSGRGIMRTAMLVPWAIPTVVGATLWGVIMRDNQSGILNVLFRDLGLQGGNEAWLATTGPWLTAVIAIDVWKTAPFMALLLLAGLQTISGDIYEAASVDGASRFRQFFSITLPLLRPTIAVALVFRTLDALRVFDVFQVLLKDPTQRPSMATYNYNRLIALQDGGYASAIGVLIFMLILIFTVIYVRFVGIEQEG